MVELPFWFGMGVMVAGALAGIGGILWLYFFLEAMHQSGKKPK